MVDETKLFKMNGLNVIAWEVNALIAEHTGTADYASACVWTARQALKECDKEDMDTVRRLKARIERWDWPRKYHRKRARYWRKILSEIEASQ